MIVSLVYRLSFETFVTCLRTVVGGTQAHAHCKKSVVQEMLSLPAVISSTDDKTAVRLR